MSADPDRACPHEDFAANVEVNRLSSEEGGPITGYMADVTIRCMQCDEPFRFRCPDAGLLFDRPTVNVSETELHVPIRPASSDPDFGLGLPGYAVRYREYSPDESNRNYEL